MTTVTVFWPRYPRVTPGGKPSHAKNAGRLVPWLSANVVNNLAHPVYRGAVAHWRTAAERAAVEEASHGPLRGRYLVSATLYRYTGVATDPFAVLEGIKPILDGFVNCGLLQGDTSAHLAGGVARCVPIKDRAGCRVVLTFLGVAALPVRGVPEVGGIPVGEHAAVGCE